MSTRSVLSLLTVFSLGIPTAMAAEPVPVPESHARKITIAADGRTVESEFYSSGKRIRNESNVDEVSLTTIMDLERKKMWALLPSSCRQLDFVENPNHPQPWSGSDSKEEVVGTDTVDGHPCKKYKRTTTVEGKTYVHFVWLATDLKGFPIKTTDEAGKYETRFTKIELGKQDPKLFEPPADCSSEASGS